MNNCIFFVEEHDMNATIYDCKLRNDGNAYPSHSPNCASCELYTTAADAMQAIALSKRLVRCKDCKHWGKHDDVEVPGETDHIKACEWAFWMVGENGYCVYGERRNDNG